MPLDADVLLLIAITLFAATVNGALGYGFSSLTVPVAVLVYASLALIRIAESTLTAIAYAFLGLYSVQTGSLVGLIAPSVIVGVPLGAYLIRRLAAETFRRICMSFDAWVVGFGFSRTLLDLGILGDPSAYVVLAMAAR